MSRTARLLTSLIAAAVVAVAIVIYVARLAVGPTPVAIAGAGQTQANLTLQTVASFGHEPNPTWVSYLVRDPSGQWKHSTIWRLPAHALIHVTIYQYDTATGLRNPFWSQPQGVEGGVMQVDGKTLHSLNPDLASHTFAVPTLGVSVPLKGVGDNAPNQCSVAPCTAAQAHTTVTFAFRTGAPGRYRWQCFVPCGAGFLFGFGGPMQTVGYMDGFLDVS